MRAGGLGHTTFTGTSIQAGFSGDFGDGRTGYGGRLALHMEFSLCDQVSFVPPPASRMSTSNVPSACAESAGSSLLGVRRV